MGEFDISLLANPDFLKELANPPAKVKAMYDAVVCLIKEDCDFASMKVSDITNRAGIGKGTAYQYFTSKEELVVKALLHDIYAQTMTVKDEVAETEGFENKFMVLLNYISDHRDNIMTFVALIRIVTGSLDTSSAYRKEYLRMDNPGKEYMESLIKWFLSFAEQENLLKETSFDYRSASLMAHIMEYVILIHGTSVGDDERTKEFIYNGFIRSLN